MSKQLDLRAGAADASGDLKACSACGVACDHFAAARDEFTGGWQAFCRICADARNIPWGPPPCWQCHKKTRVAVGRVVRGVARFLCQGCAAK
jgi:hypothetical protein